MCDCLVADEHFVAVEEDFCHGVALVAVEFDVLFYAEIIEAQDSFGSAVGVDGVVAFFVEFYCYVSCGFDLVALVMESKDLDDVHPGGFSATDWASQQQAFVQIDFVFFAFFFDVRDVANKFVDDGDVVFVDFEAVSEFVFAIRFEVFDCFFEVKHSHVVYDFVRFFYF